MKISPKLFLLLALFTILPFAAKAQLAMHMKMNRSYYLQYETVYAKVTIHNESGHAIVFGENKKLQGKLLFKIIDNDKNPVAEISETSYPMTGVIIEAGRSKDFIVPVSKYYNLKKCDTYRMYAYVEHNMFKDAYRSNETTFEISSGILRWERTVGIPEFMNSDKSGKIKQRTYKIITLLEGNRKSNYLLIDDKKRIYKVLFLSYELGEERITQQIDHLSRLHLLIPMTPKKFIYLIVDTSGKIDEETVYKRQQSVPALVLSPETGKVYVAGGAKVKEMQKL
jgi:hypothetical protein